ncbi:uncharacterized protein LOC108103992 [Drosophila eugracilis]|uniref:uncharacterized protein LOC108103992 n=1 Tax=Drosophila eugracilis TaxID=29029 RepID=UPI0007E641BE|nr:uncharacterized protein LOC108103992 [Drosophila eugracilis]
MCMPYLNKLFSSGDRRERRTRNGGITPLPSLVNATQVSADTVRTVKSGKSAKSAKSGKSGKSASRRSTTKNNGPQAKSSDSSLESNAEQSLAAASPGAVRNTAASAAPNVAPDDESRMRRSWWGYFGMNKNKKPSIESL